VGQSLGGLSEEKLERLTKLASAATRNEAYWVRRLSRLDPVKLPYRTHERAPESAGDLRALDVDVPESFYRRFGHDARGVISAFAAYLSRITACDRVALAYSDEALRTRVAGLESFFATCVPLELSFPADDSAHSAVAAVARCTEKDRATFLRDTIARYPQLAATSALASGALTPVAAFVGDDFDALEPPPGLDFALLVSPEGGRARILYDAAAQTRESAGVVRAQFMVFLTRLAWDDWVPRRVTLIDDVRRSETMPADWLQAERPRGARRRRAQALPDRKSARG
jgi:hypothetical protein